MKTITALPEPHPRGGLLGGLEREMVELGELNGPTAIKHALIRNGYGDGRMEWQEMTDPLPRPAIEAVVEMPAAVFADRYRRRDRLRDAATLTGLILASVAGTIALIVVVNRVIGALIDRAW